MAATALTTFFAVPSRLAPQRRPQPVSAIATNIQRNDVLTFMMDVLSEVQGFGARQSSKSVMMFKLLRYVSDRNNEISVNDLKTLTFLFIQQSFQQRHLFSSATPKSATKVMEYFRRQDKKYRAIQDLLDIEPSLKITPDVVLQRILPRVLIERLCIGGLKPKNSKAYSGSRSHRRLWEKHSVRFGSYNQKDRVDVANIKAMLDANEQVNSYVGYGDAIATYLHYADGYRPLLIN